MRYTALSDGCTITAPAKVNLFLEVLGKRPDGYHEIATVMQAIDLADTIEFHDAPEGECQLTCNVPGIPIDDNLVAKAVNAVRVEAGSRRGVRVHLEKRIPSGAGLGGGSSDAAATLIALDRWWGLGLSADTLRRLASSLGSDVPFFLTGGTALCTGRGEIIEPVPDAPLLDYLLAMPEGVSLSTRDVYSALGNDLTPPRADARLFVATLRRGDRGAIGAACFNRLEAPACRLAPKVAMMLQILGGMGLPGSRMSGSGAACFGLCRSPGEASTTARGQTSRLEGWMAVARGISTWAGPGGAPVAQAPSRAT